MLRGFAASLAIVGLAVAADGTPPCVECIDVRLEHPSWCGARRITNPTRRSASLSFPAALSRLYRWRNDIRRGWTRRLLAMSGPLRTVLKPGPPGSHPIAADGSRRPCRDSAFFMAWFTTRRAATIRKAVYQSMSIAQSRDYGLTWTMLGPIITGEDKNGLDPQARGIAPRSMVMTDIGTPIVCDVATTRILSRALRSKIPFPDSG